MHEWWRGAVVYQVYPRSFQDSNGDGIGDLPGITQRLDHIASLGVDAIWISPFFKSPMADYGYDVEDYRQVDPIFGSLEDLDVLIEHAHARDLKLLVDLVPCHTSERHLWFQEARLSRDNAKADWYVFADPRPDGTPPNNWLSVLGGIAWSWEPRRAQYYLHHFLPSQPALNWHNPAVAAAVVGEAEYWLERGVDGFRIDAIDFALCDPALRDNPVRPPDLPLAGGMSPDAPYARQVHIHQKSQPDLPQKVLQPLRELADRYDRALLLGELGGYDALDRIADYTHAGLLEHRLLLRPAARRADGGRGARRRLGARGQDRLVAGPAGRSAITTSRAPSHASAASRRRPTCSRCSPPCFAACAARSACIRARSWG